MIEKKISVVIIYNGEETIIEAKRDEKLKEIIKKFKSQSKNEINDFFFLYKGNMIDEECKLEKINNTDNKIKILVFNTDESEEQDYIKQSKNVICPKCKESCKINFSNYKITLDNCINGHCFSDLLLNEFKDFQSINEKKIVCHECKANKGESYQFYICCSCNINVCPLCKIKHKEHIVVNYDNKDFLCNHHGCRYILYCKKCNKNLCDLCEFDNHNCSFLYTIKKKDNNIKYLKNKIDELKNEVKNINDGNKTKLNLFIDYIEQYYNFFTNLNNNYNIKSKNYYSTININNMNDYIEKIIKDIEKIINEIKNENKFSYINKICEKMIINNVITLKYKIKNNEKIRIFGDFFVKNNKNNYQLIVNEKKCELSSFLKIEDIGKKEGDIIEIKLKQIKTAIDISFMFSECKTLINIEDISNWKTDNILNFEGMFIGCSSLEPFPDISKWNTSNVTSMSNMFSLCKCIPDISKWNTSNVTDMSNMFSFCKYKSMPNISEWNTSNVTDMSNMFNNCSTIPDISKWNTSNVTDMSYMFFSCPNIPDISKWNISNVTNMNSMFNNCSSIPDISKWNTNNVTDMSEMFCLCPSIPDISNWNTSNVTNMSGMFIFCPSIPDISKWNTNNVTDMHFMFGFCESIPDISKWNTSNVINMTKMFSDCLSLKSLPDISQWRINDSANIKFLFQNCPSLNNIPDISNWNIKHLENTAGMFIGCNSLLASLDISKWNTNSNIYKRFINSRENKINYNENLALLYYSLDNKFSISKFLDENVVLRKIIELKYNLNLLSEWAKEEIERINKK